MTFIQYFYWHYMIAPSGILRVLNNYLISTWHRFLITRHLATLFSAWHRVMPSQLPEEQTFGSKLINGVVDFYIRIVAAVIRLAIIITGLIYELILSAAFFALLIIWVLWPLVLIFSIVQGFSLL